MKNKSKILPIQAIFFLMLFSLTSFSLFGARIKDIASVEGVSGVQVIGYGLAGGLNNTGDNQQSTFTVQSVTNLLKRFGLTVPDNNPRIRNVAAVMITATVPSFLRPGSKVDVQVSSIGDATSLQGGVLMMTPLSLAQGEIIGMAQGALSVGGYDYRSLGSRVGRNFVTTARVPGGLILDKEIKSEFLKGDQINIILREPDFTTALRIAEVIKYNTELSTTTASVINSALVQVTFPSGSIQDTIMSYIARIEALTVESDPIAKIVINERTGTIVIGGNMQLLPAVIAHGGLEIHIQRQVIVPQQAPFTIRPPSIAETAGISVEEGLDSLKILVGVPMPPTVTDIANALNALQVKPRDLIAIFQALKEVGAIQGELVIQ